MLVTVILAGVVVLLTAILVHYTWHFDYWEKRKVPYINPTALSTIISGGWKRMPWSVPLWKTLDEVYWKFKDEPFVGYYQARRPLLVVRDPEVIKLVLTKEFSSFHDRGMPYDEEDDPLSANLFNLEGEKWKYLRSKLSPTFTSGKIKLMFQLMIDVSDEFKGVLKKSADKKEDIELKDVIMRYATDIIGSCAFGINCNSLKDPNSEFFQMGRSVFASNKFFVLRFLLLSISPAFAKLMPFKRLFSKTNDFFIRLMKETVDFRTTNKIERNDFVNLMMQLRDLKTENDSSKTNDPTFDFTENLMAAQAFLFFIAGLDSIANTIGFSLHELAYNEDLQNSAAAEVFEKTKDQGGKMTYESLNNMDLIDRIISEALRKWTPVAFLSRVCNEPLKIPDTDVVIDSIPQVWIPVRQLHSDPAYYPEPDRFDPDRFTEEAKETRHPYAYLPFGEGPRFCIAERFARLEMKLCLASLLRDFRVSPGAKTEVNLKLNQQVFSPTPLNGFWLKIEERL